MLTSNAKNQLVQCLNEKRLKWSIFCFKVENRQDQTINLIWKQLKSARDNEDFKQFADLKRRMRQEPRENGG